MSKLKKSKKSKKVWNDITAMGVAMALEKKEIRLKESREANRQILTEMINDRKNRINIKNT